MSDKKPLLGKTLVWSVEWEDAVHRYPRKVQERSY